MQQPGEMMFGDTYLRNELVALRARQFNKDPRPFMRGERGSEPAIVVGSKISWAAPYKGSIPPKWIGRIYPESL